MEVIEEVFALIARLERDVQQTQTELLREKHKARSLQKKTDALAMRRAVEFPIAVQAGIYIILLLISHASLQANQTILQR